jgi:hypothetical protein
MAKEKTYWRGAKNPTTCDCCGNTIAGEFVDGLVSLFWGWRQVCLLCWGLYGREVGQLYEQADGDWILSYAVKGEAS